MTLRTWWDCKSPLRTKIKARNIKKWIHLQRNGLHKCSVLKHSSFSKRFHPICHLIALLCNYNIPFHPKHLQRFTNNNSFAPCLVKLKSINIHGFYAEWKWVVDKSNHLAKRGRDHVSGIQSLPWSSINTPWLLLLASGIKSLPSWLCSNTKPWFLPGVKGTIRAPWDRGAGLQLPSWPSWVMPTPPPPSPLLPFKEDDKTLSSHQCAFCCRHLALTEGIFYCNNHTELHFTPAETNPPRAAGLEPRATQILQAPIRLPRTPDNNYTTREKLFTYFFVLMCILLS